MPLGAALVDRARFVRREPVSGEVEEIDGEKQFIPVDPEETPWFRCRLQMVKGSEVQADGRRRRVVRPAVLVGRKAVIRKGDKLEIESKEQFEGTQIFVVDGEPEPLRRRRTVIGYEATLARPE